METLATKRILRDLEMLRKNQGSLASDGIYFHVKDDNIYQLHALIIPKHKNDGDLHSPYTGGFFVFEINFPKTFPIQPPTISFHPQQKLCRLHPNYYESGKVCLSVINTWGSPDWSPSTSIMALLHILEERFTERSLCFEPGCESSDNSKLEQYNQHVEYGKYMVSILPILDKKHYMFEPFQSTIQAYFREHFTEYEKRLVDILIPTFQGKTLRSPHYGPPPFTANYQNVLEKLRAHYEKLKDDAQQHGETTSQDS